MPYTNEYVLIDLLQSLRQENYVHQRKQLFFYLHVSIQLSKYSKLPGARNLVLNKDILISKGLLF